MTPTLREQIADAMEGQSVTQAELSRRTGIPQPNLSDYLRGEADMTGERLDRILAALSLRLTARR